MAEAECESEEARLTDFLMSAAELDRAPYQGYSCKFWGLVNL